MTVSVVTVVRNGAATIGGCLDSVRLQTQGCEHLVVDGASIDGTMDIISRYPSARVISEPDSGIYDAMNKGIGLATGEIIGTLNADDRYASDAVLARVAAVFADASVEACYGDLVYVTGAAPEKVVRYWRSGSYDPSAFYSGWMPPHPTFFVRRSVFERHGGFRTEFGSAADYELMLRFLLRHGVRAVYIPEVLVKMRVGGVSNASLTNRLAANRMDRKAWGVNGLTPYPWTLFLKPLRKVGQWFARP